jgi:hypothetical protein
MVGKSVGSRWGFGRGMNWMIGAHESRSHSAMATGPAKESEIRYAVMVISPKCIDLVIAGLDPAIHLKNIP